MTVDESIKQLINTQLAEQLGGDYNKFRSYIDILNKTNKENFNEISKLKSDISDTNEKIKDSEQRFGKVSVLETLVKKLNENQSSFGQQTIGKVADLETKIASLKMENDTNLQKISALESKNREFPQKISDMGQYFLKKLDEINKDISQKIADLETKIANMERDYQNLKKENSTNLQRISVLESKSIVSPSTARTSSRNELSDQIDSVINLFNNWASCPNSNLPVEFAYVTGDFRIRTNQQELTETREETKWIINRRGAKTYLLPNPNSFNQMTNLDLYEMDLSMLKEKAKNKIKIITPCEISPSGFIEFTGKLQIIN